MIRPSVGLLGRIVAILLLAVTIEFAVSTYLYERASHVSVRDDEARRLAEHLIVARRVLNERPAIERPEVAEELTTDRYIVGWSTQTPPRPTIAPAMDSMRRQIVDWEPSLAATDIHLRLTSPGRTSMVSGDLRLDDGSLLSFRMREGVRTLDLALGRVLLALIPAIALMFVSGALIGRILHPLRTLARAADKLGRGQGASALIVPERGPKEVRHVTRAFNRMQARIGRLIDEQTRALAAVGHDLRTPLARLRLRADSIREAEVRDAIGNDIEEMEAMVSSLLAFLGGEGDVEQPELTDLAILCANLADDAADHGRDVRYAGPDHFDCRLRRFGMKRALTNLVENALHYGQHAVITLDVERSDAVRIRVEDDGPGIPEESLELVLEPFVRLDAARRRDTVGFGLGLSIVARVVAAEGGELTLANRPEGGLCAEIRLPHCRT
ncbi:signal transduction histidine kinase [Sphingomonas sp. SORGH_AS 950]|uniref:ATP-binding protein n=1 Tax=unclassified Sphingomonas TaxID=196159 RepID=UPI0027857ADF|nr:MULTISPECIES: ATP-binding protein [unclassified Sphingomonas]MDQ1156265.1 signal transduction histidine kinase [Sphingomonas sp. SORGH_AS_0950]MDR6115878.1 signal transduction histidine kinase [Sphingomonas sp. SORGH_AS_0789]MDR6150451.1 signal transduction histidine kinase [Sphingomonas sp. SORGH_AS_0742]